MTEVRARHEARTSASFHSPLPRCTRLKETLVNPRETSQALVHRWKEKMQDSRSSLPRGTGQLPGEGWTWCAGCCPANPGIPVLREEGGSQRFLVGLGCKSPPSVPGAPFHPEEPGFQGGPGQGAAGDPCSRHWADLGPGWSRGGKGVPQLEWVTHGTRQDKVWHPPCAPSWSLTNPRATSSTGQSCRSWGGPVIIHVQSQRRTHSPAWLCQAFPGHASTGHLEWQPCW